MVDQREWIPVSIEVVLQAAPHYWAARSKCRLHDFGSSKPVCGDDWRVQCPLGVVAQRLGDKAMTNVSDPVRSRVVVHTKQVGQLDIPRGFFQRFAYCSGKQRFAFIQVAGWLVENQVVAIAFLNHQEAAVLFYDGRNGAVGKPDHAYNRSD